MSTKTSKKPQKKERSVIILIIALVLVMIGGILFIGAVSGWFNDPKVTIDASYYSEEPKIIDLSNSELDDLIKNKKSFIVFVDQTGCTTADRVRKYVSEYSQENKISIYKMMFKDVKESTLHDYVKYYPSVVVVDKGKIRAYLKADSDEDADEYNDYNSFKSWLNDII